MQATGSVRAQLSTQTCTGGDYQKRDRAHTRKRDKETERERERKTEKGKEGYVWGE